MLADMDGIVTEVTEEADLGAWHGGHRGMVRVEER